MFSKTKQIQSINNGLRGWCHHHHFGGFDNGMVYMVPGLLVSDGIHLSQSRKRDFAVEFAGHIWQGFTLDLEGRE